MLLLRRPDLVLTRLLITEVREVYAEEGGILEGLRSLGDPSEPSHSTLCIDCTTLDPAIARQTANEIKKAGGGGDGKEGAWDMIDAPVSGGEWQV